MNAQYVRKRWDDYNGQGDDMVGHVIYISLGTLLSPDGAQVVHLLIPEDGGKVELFYGRVEIK